MNALEHSKNQLAGAIARVRELDEAAKALTDDAPFSAVEKLSTALTIAEARVEELTARIKGLEADAARAKEEAEVLDRNGLLELYDNAPRHSLAHLPRVLQSRIRDAVRRRGEDRLYGN